MNRSTMLYFDDDGNEIDHNSIAKPPLCVACKMNEADDEEENVFCNLNRLDQAGSSEFICGAFVQK